MSTMLLRQFIARTLVLVLPLLVVGCTVNRVWVHNTGAAGGSGAESGALRSYAKFADIKEDYRIQGMITAMVLPLARNKAEPREALVLETAAGLGANALVGLESLNHPYVDAARSRAILVNTGVQPSKNAPARPRFIVCVLPAKVKTDKTKLAAKLEPFLIPELQFHLAQKGYYAYLCSSTSVDASALTAGNETPVEFREPLGVEPDFVLTCEIEQGGYSLGVGVKTLRIHVRLYDLQRRMTVWEDVQPIAGWDLIDAIVDPKGTWAVAAGDKHVHDAVKLASEKLSPVGGFGELKK